jgi:hypothetical protein
MGNIPLYPNKVEGAIFRLPWVWCGNVAVDGTVEPWKSAPLGSQYTRITASNVTLRIKTASAAATADWLTVTAS